MSIRSHPQRVLLLGATGTIGRATARALLRRGHEVSCLVRLGATARGLPAEADLRPGDVRDPQSVARDGLRGERFDAVVS